MPHKNYRNSALCLNCGHDGCLKFCPNCGQENIEPDKRFFSLLGHFIQDYLHFESRLLRSLALLITKPGHLTVEYWEGRRVKYTDPLRLFFFLTLFFVISTSVSHQYLGEQFREKLLTPDPDLKRINEQALQAMNDSTIVHLIHRKKAITVLALKRELRNRNAVRQKVEHGFDRVFLNLKYIMFFLLPVYALVFRLLYRKRSYVDHVIYMMHVQSFMFLFLGIILLLPFIFPIGINGIRHLANVFITPYLVMSLHTLYHQRWYTTILKSLVASFWVIFTTIFSIVFLSYLFA